MTCQYCGVGGPASELTIDHVVPVSRGGAASTWENQVVACRRCNGRKANSQPTMAPASASITARMVKTFRRFEEDRSTSLFDDPARQARPRESGADAMQK